MICGLADYEYIDDNFSIVIRLRRTQRSYLHSPCSSCSPYTNYWIVAYVHNFGKLVIQNVLENYLVTQIPFSNKVCSTTHPKTIFY